MGATETDALIRRYIDAFNAGDWASMLACLDEDVAHDLHDGGREIGRAAFRDALAKTARHFRETVEDVVVLVSADGTRAAAEYTIHGEYLATAADLPPAAGQRYSISAGQFFDVDDGRLSRVTDYRDVRGWTAALAKN